MCNGMNKALKSTGAEGTKGVVTADLLGMLVTPLS